MAGQGKGNGRSPFARAAREPGLRSAPVSQPSPKVEKRFLRALRSSGLVKEADLARALDVQRQAAERGRALPIDRILLKLGALDRDQILGLWRALRYYLWRREDKFYVKLAQQAKPPILTPEAAKSCLREQKNAYKHEDQLLRVNEIARQRGYVKAAEDRALVEAMRKLKPVTLRPVDERRLAELAERPTPGAAKKGGEDAWRRDAHKKEIAELRAHVASQSSAEIRGVSDPDLDALWDEADLDDVELDSQAVEIAGRAPFELEDSDEDDIDLPP
jgi:hypothetical protein